MAVIDHERALALLKQRIQSKDTWGRRQLQDLLVEIEAECLIEEGLPEKALRLYGTDLFSYRPESGTDESPNGHRIDGAAANGTSITPSRG